MTVAPPQPSSKSGSDWLRGAPALSGAKGCQSAQAGSVHGRTRAGGGGTSPRQPAGTLSCCCISENFHNKTNTRSPLRVATSGCSSGVMFGLRGVKSPLTSSAASNTPRADRSSQEEGASSSSSSSPPRPPWARS